MRPTVLRPTPIFYPCQARRKAVPAERKEREGKRGKERDSERQQVRKRVRGTPSLFYIYSNGNNTSYFSICGRDLVCRIIIPPLYPPAAIPFDYFHRLRFVISLLLFLARSLFEDPRDTAS